MSDDNVSRETISVEKMFHVKQLDVEYLNSCPLCHSQEFEEALRANDYLTSFGEFTIVRCRDCSLLFTNPRPAPHCSVLCYPASKYQSHKKSRASLFDRVYFLVQNFMFLRKLKLVKGLVGGNTRLLDVGSGVGSFASFMSKKGFSVSAIEPSYEARRQAQEIGITVFEDLDHYSKSGTEPPHVISLWHVLEHQHDFLENLRKYNSVLPREGVLIIAVPQFESFDARFYGNKWAAYDLPRHIYHFNKETLVASAHKAGFKLLKTRGMPFDSFYISLLSEHNKRNKLGFFRAPLIALISNALALCKARPWSSQIFVFQKLS